MVTFPGVHSSAVQGYSFFLDLLNSPPEEGVWDILREEVQSISSGGQGVWTVKDLDRAILLDSAIKESLRLNGLSSLTPIRKVTLSLLVFLEPPCSNTNVMIGGTNQRLYSIERYASSLWNLRSCSPILHPPRSRIVFQPAGVSAVAFRSFVGQKYIPDRY